MKDKILIKEISIEEAVKVNASIIEFDEKYPKEYFKNRYKDRSKLIIVAYVNDFPAGYIVAYDRDQDGSFYCWMAGVDPAFRRQGVLKKLMEYQDKWAVEHDYKKNKVKTRNTRREMLAYLVKYGYYFTNVELRDNIQDNRISLEKNL